MRFQTPRWGTVVVCLSIGAALGTAHDVAAATIQVPAGGDLQAALNAAQGGDVVALAPGATYVGNFVLPRKDGVTVPIVVRTGAPDSSLPPAGVRMTPAFASVLAKIKSPNNMSALRTATAAHHWTLMLLEFQGNVGGYGEIIALGAGDSTQTSYAQVPYALVLDRLYVHGDPMVGQKRGIALNSRDTEIINSWVSDCKVIGQDSQAIGGFNGPGNYLIENNYLEGAAENFMLGGADPTIPDLVPTNVVFRHNHLKKPLSWRDPIMPGVGGVQAAAVEGGGTLAAGTYYYKVAARRTASQGNKATSDPSAEVFATVADSGAVTISWAPVSDATEYYVWGRTPGSQTMYWRTTAPFFTDTGAAGTSGTPYRGTKWAVKNIFELKNAQDVVIEGNVFENLWVADQSGFAILFTPRNQDGAAPWVVVQRVIFRNNLVRHIAGGVNILGRDNLAPSQRTSQITIENNVFDDMTSATWGGGSRFAMLGDGPDAITIDHNTVITTTGSILWMYGGTATAPTAATNVKYTNNMSAHNAYGIMGSNFGYGTPTIDAYLPGGVVTNNVLADGPASRYPAGNLFPTAAAWANEFVDYSGGDYRLKDTSTYRTAATDGKALGADIDAVNKYTAVAISGDNRSTADTGRVQILTTELPHGTLGAAYAQTLECGGGSGRCGWAMIDGVLPGQLSFDPLAAVVSGTPSAVESGTFTVEAFDAAMPDNKAQRTFTLEIDAPPFELSVPPAPLGQVGTPYQLATSISGAVGTPSWSVVAGELPSGLALDAFSGVVAGTPASWGTITAVLQGSDSWRPDRIDQKPLTITVAPSALRVLSMTLSSAMHGQPYHAQLAAEGGTGATAWSLIDGSLPAGVSLSGDGALTGVPAASGAFSFTVEARDVNWQENAARGAFTLTVEPSAFTIAVAPAVSGSVGAPLQVAAVAQGALGSVTWSIADGELPEGVTLDRTSGLIAGVPAVSGQFVVTVQASDSYAAGRVATAILQIDIAPLPLMITTSTLPRGTTGTPYVAALNVTGGSGAALWSVAGGALPGGVTLSADGTFSGTPSVAGTFEFTVVAVDAQWTANAAAAKLSIAVDLAPVRTSSPEIVLHAAAATTVVGNWSVVRDVSAAGGARMANPNLGADKVNTPLAAPADYFELTFRADAGVPYHLWVRGKAERNAWVNDSAHFQFSGTVTAAGAPLYRIGSTSAASVTIEDHAKAGLSGWGWQDNAIGALAAPLYFEGSGLQTVRIQVREDGLSIDQIVLSSSTYLMTSPGALKNDTTILGATATAAPREIVLFTADASAVYGKWARVADPTAAAGHRLANPNAGVPKLTTAFAQPADYFEMTFYAVANTPYHLWMRGIAEGNLWVNDSAFVQFSDAVDASGAPVWAIGTTSATVFSLEEGTNAGLAGWGWQDNSYGSLAAPIFFATTGMHTIRVQSREDGLSIDQIVLSPGAYLDKAPGPTKNDATILGR